MQQHVSVGGTLVESHASLKSVRPIAEVEGPGGPGGPGPPGGNGFKPRNPDVDFRGEGRTNATHRSATDPEARLYRKSAGQGTRLRHPGHAPGENRHGLILGVAVAEANGTAEREAAVDLVDAFRDLTGWDPATVGPDEGYDSGDLLLDLERPGVEPHGAPAKPPRAEAAARPKERDQVAARHRMAARATGAGYRLSQGCRKNLEGGVGWLKGVTGLARSRVVGRRKIQQLWELGATAYNLVRMRRLLAAA